MARARITSRRVYPRRGARRPAAARGAGPDDREEGRRRMGGITSLRSPGRAGTAGTAGAARVAGGGFLVSTTLGRVEDQLGEGHRRGVAIGALALDGDPDVPE